LLPVQMVKNTLVVRHREASEQTHDRLEVRHALKSKELADYRIMACDLSVLKPIGPTPYRDHELADELHGRVATIASGLWQARTFQRTRPSYVIEHALEQCQATPRGHFLVAESQIKFHTYPQKKSLRRDHHQKLNNHQSNQTLALMASIRNRC
jgi:hypothetical protein